MHVVMTEGNSSNHIKMISKHSGHCEKVFASWKSRPKHLFAMIPRATKVPIPRGVTTRPITRLRSPPGRKRGGGRDIPTMHKSYIKQDWNARQTPSFRFHRSNGEWSSVFSYFFTHTTRWVFVPMNMFSTGIIQRTLSVARPSSVRRI